MIGGWVEQAAAVRFGDVASHLGITQVRGRTIAPCPNPACGATRRGSGDPRGAVDLADRDGKELWHCKRCNTGGDAFAAVCFVLGGARFSALTPDDKAKVRAWYADRGWCEAAEGHTRPAVVPAPKAKRMDDDVAQRAAEYPPEGEAERFCGLCSPIPTTPDNANPWPSLYLRDRGLDADLLSKRLDIVRATPARLDRWPAWWPGWIADGDGPRWAMFRLAVRAYDAAGVVRSIHARRVLRYRTFIYRGELFADPLCEGCGGALDRENGRPKEKCPACEWVPKPKTLWPVKCSSERLLFADPGGVALLKHYPPAQVPKDVLIVEGLTDTLRGASVAPSVPCAVLGFTSGGAQALADVRWRRDMRLGVATDDDKAGDAYAEQVADAVRPLGIALRRIRWASLMGGAGR